MSDSAAPHHEHRARRMWRALEPVHAVTYFAPEPKACCDALGTKGYWMSYFAQRAAPLGAAPPQLVTALFYNFHPALVARAVPDVWGVASPRRFLQARLEGVDAALRRLWGPDVLASPELAEAAEVARVAALAAPTAGRPLAAANAALDWPEAPHLVLWQAQTILREQRGDGHNAALLTAGLDPAEALVLFAADAAMDGTWLRTRRGWSEAEWTAAAGRLAARGLINHRGTAGDAGATDPGGTPAGGTPAGGTPAGGGPAGGGAAGVALAGGARAGVAPSDGTPAGGAPEDGGPEPNWLTEAGRALRAAVEARTDALADVPWAVVGQARAERLVELVTPLVAAVLAGDGFLAVNPMGLRPLVSA